MVRFYQMLFYFSYNWQKNVMKENDIPILSAIFTMTGEIVLWLIALDIFLTNNNIIRKNFDENNIIGYSIITVILIFNIYYFNNPYRYKKILNFYKNTENILILKTLYYLYVILPILYIFLFIWS